MLIQTNGPAIKAKQGIPVEVVEEWLADRARGGLLDDDTSIHRAKITPMRKERKRGLVSAKHEVVKNDMVARILAGEYVRVSDYTHKYPASTVASIMRGAGIEIRRYHPDSPIFAVHDDDSSARIGFVKRDALFEILGVASEPSFDAPNDYQPTVETYAADRVHAAKKLLGGGLLRTDDYCIHHPRVMALRVYGDAVSVARKEHKKVLALHAERGIKAGWILQSALSQALKTKKMNANERK